MIARAIGQVRQFLCGLHGHDALLHFERERVSLQCTSCGYESPGWDLTRAPRVQPVEAGTRRIIRLPLFGERRAA